MIFDQIAALEAKVKEDSNRKLAEAQSENDKLQAMLKEAMDKMSNITQLVQGQQVEQKGPRVPKKHVNPPDNEASESNSDSEQQDDDDDDEEAHLTTRDGQKAPGMHQYKFT